MSFFQDALPTPVTDSMTPEEVNRTIFFYFFLSFLPNPISHYNIITDAASDWPIQIKAWEDAELDKPIDIDQIRIDPSPFQLVERTSLHKVASCKCAGWNTDTELSCQPVN